MRKCLVFLVTILMTVTTLSASHALFLSEGDIDDVRLFTPYGEAADLTDEILSDGYIIRTKNSNAVFSSPFGSILLLPSTLLAVTGYNFEDPSLYLLDGSVSVDLSNELDLVIYTSSASYTLSGSGKYAFTYTDVSDLAINYSDKPVQVYDALRKNTSTLDGYHYSDLLANRLNVPLFEVASTGTEEDAVPVEYARGIYTFESFSLEYSFATSGSGYVHYPVSCVTVNDINSFLASFLSASGLEGLAKLVTYSIDEENGRVSFTYADTYTRGELMDVVSAFTSYLEAYLVDLFTPDAPAFLSVECTVRKSVPQSFIRLESVTKPSTPSTEENLKKLSSKTQEASEQSSIRVPIVGIIPSTSSKDGESLVTVRETPFDIYYSTSFIKKSGEEPDFSLAFLAEYASDDFLFRLSLDPFHIVTWKERETLREWFSYFASFVSALSYTTPDGRFSIKLGNDLILLPDPFGVTSALTNSFSPTSTMLHALTTYDGDFYSHTISYSDITFEEEEGYLSYNANITLPGYPLRFGFSLLSAINHSDLSQTRLIPEIYIASPLAFADSFSLSMQLTAALSTSFAGKWFDGWGISLSLPFVFDSISFDTGLAYTQGGLRFGEYLNGYVTEREGNNTLTLYGRGLFESDPFALILDLQLPLDLKTFTLVEGEDYFSVEVSGELFSISLSFGLRLTGLLTDFDKGFEESGEAFIALGYSNEALETKMAIYLDKNLEPEIALSATLSGYRAIFARNRNLATSPSWLDIELYTGYNNDSTASLFFRPTVRFNFSDNLAIGLRLPLSITTIDGNFVFAKYGVDPDFNFGSGAQSTTERLYDMFTDLFSLFEFIRMGKQNENFWFLAERNHSFSNPLFDHYQAYGKQGSLGLDVGFVLPGRASAVFQIEDLERPDLFNLTMSMKPMGEDGPELILDNVVDLFIQSGKTETIIISQFAISQSLLNNSISLAFYFNTHFEITEEGLDFHFTSRNDLSISFGVSLDTTLSGGWVIPFSFGFNSGWAQEHYYDEFVYLYRERLNKEDAIFYDPMQLFIDLGFYYEGEHLSFGASYYVPSIQNYLNENSKDRIRLSFSCTINDFTFEASLSRRNFRNSLASDKGLEDYIKDEDTVFALSMEKIFSHLSFYTSIFLTPSYETITAYNDSIVAVPGSTSLAFSLITSLRF